MKKKYCEYLLELLGMMEKSSISLYKKYREYQPELHRMMEKNSTSIYKRSLLLSLCAATMLLLWSSPGHAQPVMNKARIDLELGQDTQSMVFEKLAMAYAMLRKSSVSDAEKDAARRLLQEAVELDESRSDTHFQVALFYGSELLDQGAMFAHLERFVELASPRHIGWAEANEMLGDRAWSRFVQSSARASTNPHLLDAERYYLAAYDALLGTELLSVLAKFDLSLGAIAHRQGDLARALRYFRAFMDHSPAARPDAAELIASVLVQLDRADEAVALLEAMAAESNVRENTVDRLVSFSISLAQAHSANGSHSTALQYLERTEMTVRAQPEALSTMLSGDLARLYDATASVYIAMGDYPQSEDFHRKAYGLTGAPTYQNNLAWSIALGSSMRDPKLEEALQLSMAAVAAEPSASYLDTLAEVLLRLERFDEALDTIDEALLFEPNSLYLLEQRKRIVRAQSGFVGQARPLQRLELWDPPTHLML